MVDVNVDVVHFDLAALPGLVVLDHWNAHVRDPGKANNCNNRQAITKSKIYFLIEPILILFCSCFSLRQILLSFTRGCSVRCREIM
jgi:hypothetical protein